MYCSLCASTKYSCAVSQVYSLIHPKFYFLIFIDLVRPSLLTQGCCRATEQGEGEPTVR